MSRTDEKCQQGEAYGRENADEHLYVKPPTGALDADAEDQLRMGRFVMFGKARVAASGLVGMPFLDQHLGIYFVAGNFYPRTDFAAFDVGLICQVEELPLGVLD